MAKKKKRMDEGILVCIYYGPNGERLIRRGSKIAQMVGCPLYILTVDPKPFDELDAERSMYILKWKQLAKELEADAFILRDNEPGQAYKVIAEVAREKNVSQIVIGQTVQSRWEQITKEYIVNLLLREIPFVDLHVISVAREIRDPHSIYEKGLRAYLKSEGDQFRLVFKHSKDIVYEGIFFKEIGTDFNNGIFRFIKDGETLQVRVLEDMVSDFTNCDMETVQEDDNE
ncbi:MAG: universal stress protein [Desulfitobacterium sp.]|nr:universal stress protein [Desulfitobacterium sp.]